MGESIDSDTMFESWVVTGNEKLKEDFSYYFPTDPRNEYMDCWCIVDGKRTLNNKGWGDLSRLLDLFELFFANERMGKYWEMEKSRISKILTAEQERRKHERSIFGRIRRLFD